MNFNLSNMTNIKFKSYNNSPITLTKVYYKPYGQTKIQVWPVQAPTWTIIIRDYDSNLLHTLTLNNYPTITDLGGFTHHSNGQPDIDELFIGDPDPNHEGRYCAYTKVNGNWSPINIEGFGVDPMDPWNPASISLIGKTFVVFADLSIPAADVNQEVADCCASSVSSYSVTKVVSPSGSGVWSGPSSLNLYQNAIYEITPYSSYKISAVSINPSTAAVLTNGNNIRQWNVSSPIANFNINATLISHPSHTWQSYQSISSANHARYCIDYPACVGYEESAHTASSIYQFDSSNHWQLCSVCGYNGGYNFGSHSIAQQYNNTDHWNHCSICSWQSTTQNHGYPSSWTSTNSTQHQKKCNNCNYIWYENHSLQGNTIYTNRDATYHYVNTRQFCTNGCGYSVNTNTIEGHSWNNGAIIENKNATSHYKNIYNLCNKNCGYAKWTYTIEDHDLVYEMLAGSDTQHRKYCSYVTACGYTVTETHTLSYSNEDNSYHHVACAYCGYSVVSLHNKYNTTWSNSYGSWSNGTWSQWIGHQNNHTRTRTNSRSYTATRHWLCNQCNYDYTESTSGTETAEQTESAAHIWDVNDFRYVESTSTVHFKIEYHRCTECNYTEDLASPVTEYHSYLYTADDASTHTAACQYCNYEEVQAHSFTYSYNSSEHWPVCSKCGYDEPPTSHTMVQDHDDAGHWEVCSICQYQTASTSHSWSRYTVIQDDFVTHNAWCSCGYVDEDPHVPNSSGWHYHASKHWQICSLCGGQMDKAEHYKINGVCQICGYTEGAPPVC